MEANQPAIPYVDTSALAKWYLNEVLSEEVDAYLCSLPFARISSLTVVEMRCLLARRRRFGELTGEQELQCRALFEDDVGQGYLRVLPLDDAYLQAALQLIDRLPDRPLRTLDALHLAIVRSYECEVLATADRVMADLGIPVRGFFDPPPAGDGDG